MRMKTWLICITFFLIASLTPLSGLASPRERGGMRFDRDSRGAIHEGFHGGFYGGYYRGFYSPRVFIGPAYGFGWGWGNPWIWDPYYYPYPDTVQVRHVNYGTLEFKVKPEETKVYIDKKFIGTVEDLDHHKAYVAAGNHDVVLKAPDGQTIDRTIYVAAGKKIKIEERL